MRDRYIGKRIGNYQITEPIASGGFGHVYKATHSILKQRTVAVKFLRTHLHNEREQERFIMEAELLEMLQHPHIYTGSKNSDRKRARNKIY